MRRAIAAFGIVLLGWEAFQECRLCMFFLYLFIRGTINAVTVICRQAGRRAGPDWTGALLIYG